MQFQKIIVYKVSPQWERVSISILFMLHTLIFALRYQDKHATHVWYTAGNHSINMAVEYICMGFKHNDMIWCFVPKHVFVIIENLSSGSYF